MSAKVKTWSVQTVKINGNNKYHQEVGKLIEFEDEGRTLRKLELYMFPETFFKVKEDPHETETINS